MDYIVSTQQDQFTDLEFPGDKQSLIPNWSLPSGEIKDIEVWERY